MASRSKIVFISSDENMSCEEKMKKYKEEGKIDVKDLVILETGAFYYIDSNGNDHKVGGDTVAFQNLDDITEEDKNQMKPGQTVVVKNDEGEYEQYLVQETEEGLVPVKASASIKEVDTVKTDVEELNKKVEGINIAWIDYTKEESAEDGTDEDVDQDGITEPDTEQNGEQDNDQEQEEVEE